MLRIRHRITNLGDEVFDFIWCLHPAFDTTRDYRIDLPASKVLVEHYGPAFFEQEADSYTWPHYRRQDGEVDMRFWLPPGTPKVQLHYAMLDRGWLAFTDQAAQQSIGMAFPVDIFPVVGLWLLYGWRGLYAVTLAPWSAYPVRLHEAVENSIYSHLEAGESLECETRVVLYSGFTEISGIDMEGSVTGSNDPR